MKQIILFLLVFPAMCFSQVINDGLVSYWPFNGGADDMSGNNIHGAAVGASLINDKDGNSNSAYVLNGNDHNIHFGNDNGLLNFNAPKTVSFWLKLNGNPTGSSYHAIYQRLDSRYQGFSIFIKINGVLAVHTGPNYETNHIVTDDLWHHYTITVDSNNIKFYVDGILVNQVTNPQLYNVVNPVYHNIGKFLHYGGLNGTIDEFSIHNRVLNETEIQSLFGGDLSTVSYGWKTGVSKVYVVAESVGIGTKTPDAKLTVKGKIHAEEVKIDLSVPAPDYVFKKDYELLTIEEVQKHIKEKGHLPNIPSAAVLETEGVELGVMNMKLLEKIEELTLYTIAQEKQLQQQQKTNKALEARLEKLEVLLMKQ